ncbi:rod shape-determining protein MreD [Sandarakinorhabdus rubra]|uniref:rod shape-determining protein MreD n=1 Tax=Sandarakinorhabdus rubra TaxID=2672568 RepID=UPI0013DB5B54|nr:rod shape-determining protein MreD [Sandarakinorhabdus rubra]
MIAPPPPPALLMTPQERRRWLLSTWRYAVPALVSILLLLVMVAPLPLPLPAMPQLSLMAVLAWALLQPQLMPPWIAFLVGGVADLLFGLPLGVNATGFAVSAGLMRLLSPLFGRNGLMFDWLAVSGLLLCHALLAGPLMALAGQPVPLWPLALQWLTSILAWPLVARFCAALQRRLAASVPSWRGG